VLDGDGDNLLFLRLFHLMMLTYKIKDLRKIGLGVWSGFSWLRIGTGGAGCCEYGDEPAGSGAREIIN
jgi:hypothetical protein